MNSNFIKSEKYGHPHKVYNFTRRVKRADDLLLDDLEMLHKKSSVILKCFWRNASISWISEKETEEQLTCKIKNFQVLDAIMRYIEIVSHLIRRACTDDSDANRLRS